MTHTAASFSVPLLALTLVASPAVVEAQQVRLSVADGRVTLDATNAPPSAILAEWARVGGTRIVDGDRVPGMPLTLRLEDVPEREALDIILRSAAGYIAAARPAGTPGASVFDRIVVMGVSVNAAAARSGPAPATAAPMAVAPSAPEVNVPGQDAAQPDVADEPVQSDDAVGGEQPVSSTDFDYANPQRYFAARAAQQRAAESAAQQQGDANGTTDAQGAAAAAPGGFSTGSLLSTPGIAPVPAAQPPAPSNRPPVNPYGLPADVAPGSSGAPPMEPDRSKYINPYAPTPPQGPPGQ